MVEMTPEHLEAQVEMELQKNEDSEVAASLGSDTAIVDFSARLIDKKVKEEPSESDAGPALPVDPLSLSSLLSQGFEEGPARKALRKHQNNTQAALDWLINGQAEEEEKKKLVSADGVRMPTTVKRVQKLKAMRRAQQEKLKEKRDSSEGGAQEAEGGSRGSGEAPGGGEAGAGGSVSNGSGAAKEPPAAPPQDMLSGDSPVRGAAAGPPPDLLEGMEDRAAAGAAAKGAPAMGDLLSLDERPAEPTDFSKRVDITSLPPQLAFDMTKCEKQPLSAAVAAGLVQPRPGANSASSFTDLLAASASAGFQGLDFGQARGAAGAASAGAAGVSPGTVLTNMQDIFGDLVNLGGGGAPGAPAPPGGGR